jgi:predicted transcriptional regulator of viral defense system
MKRRADWTKWLETVPSKGRVTFELEEAVQRASGERRTAINALRRAAIEGRVAHIQRGFFAWVAPEYRSAKAPPFNWVIHAWMGFLQSRYYVGLLSAASLHGSAHHAPMENQVVTSKQIRATTYGDGRVRFIARRNNWPPDALLEKKSGYQDSFFVSGPELTLVDLVKNPAYAGGWDNIATIAKDLGGKIRLKNLSMALDCEETPILQRLGWIFDQLGFTKAAEEVSTALGSRFVKKTLLDPRVKVGGDFDPRFQLTINHKPELEG